MASAYKGDDEVCISWVGDGTSAQGDYHYALNFASTFKPPVILNVVNNQWAISTHANLATGGRTFAERGLAYDIPSIRVDGNDFLALYSVTKWARDRDEAQNASSMQMKMFLTRLGEGSRMAITGDRSQIDLPKGITSGLVEAERLLSSEPKISFNYFSARDVVRHPLVASIIEASLNKVQRRQAVITNS